MSSLRKYLPRRTHPQARHWTDQVAQRRHIAATQRPHTTPPISLTLR